ncbi:hypothetical protein UK23_08425 [Lentzea aerocolonigenes]|uniref:Uncharacterized protein n=1 Tax=Lentzea aerocolonigenes TaxID=68170 RepID=A0A0F0H687_LENAE|nr:hypothetical protein UK23_08425 [Lentzea aerocolonigenes]
MLVRSLIAHVKAERAGVSINWEVLPAALADLLEMSWRSLSDGVAKIRPDRATVNAPLRRSFAGTDHHVVLCSGVLVRVEM